MINDTNDIAGVVWIQGWSAEVEFKAADDSFEGKPGCEGHVGHFRHFLAGNWWSLPEAQIESEMNMIVTILHV